MPTGYTAKLYDEEQSFEDFVKRCARAMGALYHMRDESLDAEIKLPEAKLYYYNKLQEAERNLSHYEGLSDRQWEKEAEQEYKTKLQAYHEINMAVSARRARYDAMIEAVQDWTPPTDDHVSFKEFMLQQLNDSKYADCYQPQKPERRSAAEVKEHKLSRAREDVEYYAKQAESDKARRTRSVRWINKLLDSLETG